VFVRGVLRRIFGPKREEVAGGWRRLHNDELHNLYVSPNVISVIQKRRMRWDEHVVSTGDEKCIQNFGPKVKGRDHAEDLVVNGRILLGGILGKYDGKVWSEFIWLRIGTSGGLL
jgi:hypothetical protein